MHLISTAPALDQIMSESRRREQSRMRSMNELHTDRTKAAVLFKRCRRVVGGVKMK